MFDLVIKNAKICDGSGEPSFVGSVAVTAGKIVAVGKVSGDARETIDAGGLALTPGFIDQHTHYDAQLIWDGLAQPSLEHGVTTIMPGNCSLSLAPVKVEHRDYLEETFRKIEEMPKPALDAGLTWNWQTFGEYIGEIRKGLGINVAPIVGHSLLRLWVIGLDSRKRQATAAEVVEMQVLLRQCFEAGAVALSTSWVDIDVDNRPVPCRLAHPDELDALCEVVAEFSGTLQVVPEFWDADMLSVRIDILADISRKYGITTTFSPLFDSVANPQLTTSALDRVRLQAANGARVVPQMQVRAIDIAFELTTPGSIFSALPNWWTMMAGGPDEIKRQLRDPEQRKLRVAEAMAIKPDLGLDVNFNEAKVKRVSLPQHQPLIGRKLKDIAAERGVTSADVMVDIALAEDLDASFGLEELGHSDADKIGTLLADKHISVGAGDGGAHLSRFATYGDTGFLFSRYVRCDHGMKFGEAVRKLTSDIAKHWGLKDRGLICVGYAADLVLFDERTIDRGPEYAEYDLPGGPGSGFRYVRRAVGVSKVWVNGQLTYDVEQGYTDARAGVIAEGGAGHVPQAPAVAPPSIRKWTYAKSGDSWEKLALRTLPDTPVEEAVARLKSWNLYLAYRPAPAEITPTDVLFTEAPIAA
jgi:N-acyl-D-amino-acid deacylase